MHIAIQGVLFDKVLLVNANHFPVTCPKDSNIITGQPGILDLLNQFPPSLAHLSLQQNRAIQPGGTPPKIKPTVGHSEMFIRRMNF